jgi:hypothetical protein
MPVTNQTVYLDDIKQNSSLKYLDKCFNSSSKYFILMEGWWSSCHLYPTK